MSCPGWPSLSAGSREDLVAARNTTDMPREPTPLQNESICETDHAQDYMS